MRPTTDLFDDHQDVVATCSVQFQHYGGRRHFGGRVRTVECHHDNVLFRKLLEQDGAIRDSVDVGQIDTGVLSLGLNPAKSAKAGKGSVDSVVTFGGVSFKPGDWVYCDEDGVLLSPTELR